MNLFLGIDIGSTTVKMVVIDENVNILNYSYQRTKAVETGGLSCSGKCTACGKCNMGAIRKTVVDFLAEKGLALSDMTCTIVTGSQITEDATRIIPYDRKVSEISAHVTGARHFYPDVEAIIDCGGQDSKCMVYNGKMGLWTSMMSGVCAAGTGSYLDNVALKLGIPVEQIADNVNYESDVEFSSVCAVLSATSVNKFKNRLPLGDILAGACKAQARTILNSVGQLLLHKCGGRILFQGGVASNRAVAYYLQQLTGSEITVPQYHHVMGAIGAAILAKQYHALSDTHSHKSIQYAPVISKSSALRVQYNKSEFLGSEKDKPLVWRNLFFPMEILNAFDVRTLTMETYAALHGRDQKNVKQCMDIAARKGFDQQTCSFLRVLEGLDLERPAFAVSTSQPCQQGERIFADLAADYGFEDRCYSVHTPLDADSPHAIDQLAQGLEEAIDGLERSLGRKLDTERLKQACILSNQAADYARKCIELRSTCPPLVRSSKAVYEGLLFSQLWGRQELVDIQKMRYEELLRCKEWAEQRYGTDDTHRLIWLHLPPFYSRDILNCLENTCNAPIIFEEVNYVGWEPLDVNDPIRSLARKILTSGLLNPKLRIDYIRKEVEHAKMNGVILYTHGFGRCNLADRPFTKRLKEMLEGIGVPLLTLEGDCMDASIDPCSTTTKIESFIESLNSKRYGNLFGLTRKD